MSTKACTGRKTSGTTDCTDDLPSDATEFGVDGEGAQHYYSSDEDSIFVVENDEIEQIALEGTPMYDPYEWARHVYEQRGEWESLEIQDYPPSEMEALADSVAERYGGGV